MADKQYKATSKEEFAQFLKGFRSNFQFTQEQLITLIEEKTGLSITRRTYQYWEAGKSLPQKGLDAILHLVQEFSEKKDSNIVPKQKKTPSSKISKQDHEFNHALLDIALEAALEGACMAIWTYHHPGWVDDVSTSQSKSNQDDKTHPMDYFADKAIEEYLMTASKTPGNPLSKGFIYFSEEERPKRISGLNGKEEDLIVLIDPVDFTESAKLGIEGATLVSIFSQRKGVLVSVVVDLFRDIVFSRQAGRPSFAQKFVFNQDPASSKTNKDELKISLGSPINLFLSDQTSLNGATLNIFTGKPSRMLLAGIRAQRIFDRDTGVKTNHSVGGSVAMARLAEGVYDATIEVRGYRPWDFIPGAFIADGANAVVIDLEGNEIDFGNDRLKFKDGEISNERQEFIIASTVELAEIICDLIDKPPIKLSKEELLND